MSLEIEHRLESGVTVLKLTGRLNLGPATNQLRTHLRELIASGHSNLLLDLSQVLHIDSAGLGEIVAAYKASERAGGRLKLLSLPAQIHELMRSTKLLAVFEVFEDESTALASYQ